ncbi:hypothetical protein HK103_001750 [Boothiomyces macroporosus]|uniref:Uncharacterized protein n=1 Tax=Boothiomyces macroporosus TaxID=261099 RepID=A0AAD5Y521_9FUNG|nr:hypothetical protein HK103_001750 [Boothiomyces macroporosus]
MEKSNSELTLLEKQESREINLEDKEESKLFATHDTTEEMQEISIDKLTEIPIDSKQKQSVEFEEFVSAKSSLPSTPSKKASEILQDLDALKEDDLVVFPGKITMTNEPLEELRLVEEEPKQVGQWWGHALLSYCFPSKN